MNTDRIVNELRTFQVPTRPGALDRAIAAARAAHHRREPIGATARRRRRGVIIALASAMAVVVISVTPAGHAATGWVTKVVGITHIPENHPPRGHVGGRPTDPSSLGLKQPNAEIVIAQGRTPTGQPYELSVSRSPQARYGTCFTLWAPKMDQPNRQGTIQCARRGEVPAIGPFCVANSSGCGDSHHSPQDRRWTTPALAVLGPKVTRISVRSKTPRGHIAGIRVVDLSRKFQHEVGAPQRVSAGIFFMAHPAASAVRFTATGYDRRGQAIAHSSEAIGGGPAG